LILIRTRIFAETDITLLSETLINNRECFHTKRTQKRNGTRIIMAFDALSRIDGVDRESTDENHRAGWINNLIIILMVVLWALSSTSHAQQWTEYPENESRGQSVDDLLKHALQYPEDRIIKKSFKVTTQWQTIAFDKPLQINRKGLMGLHIAVDNQLYISTMYDHPLNPKCKKTECAVNAFCLRRIEDGALVRPEAVLIGDNNVEVSVRPAGHLYPYFDKNAITVALRAFKDGRSSPPPFPKGIKAFKAIRIRSTEPFQVRFLYWNVDRYPYYH
jgi:hypothetical protein